MADEDAPSGLRDRIARQGEDALGKLAQELLENPTVNSAIARAFDARERAVACAGAAIGALSIPSARRRRAPDARAALGVPAHGGHRGRGSTGATSQRRRHGPPAQCGRSRIGSPALGGFSDSGALGGLRDLADDARHAPAPSPREQEHA